jgi:hypothetical protein
MFKRKREIDVSVRQHPGFCLRIYRKQKLEILHCRARRTTDIGS